MEVTTESGRVRGRAGDGVTSFHGIPYAQGPTGELRFAPPEPHQPWDGVRDATELGPTAPQTRRTFPGLDVTPGLGPGWRRDADDDYLTVDIWTPDPDPAAALPVLVFVHGGAFVAGTGTAAIYDGTAFARAGAVLVTLNYRVGAEGFLAFPDAPTNVGLRDQLAALRWVRDNIAAFGGDPGQVTVFGESAGAMSIGMYLASPAARDLFGRAVLQSGGADVGRSAGVMARLTERLAAALGVAPTAKAFRDVPVERLIEVQADVLLRRATDPTTLDLRDDDGWDPGLFIAAYLPVIGDDIVPSDPVAAAPRGVELVLGTNAEEGHLYVVPNGWLTMTAEQATALLGTVHPEPARVLNRFARTGSPGRALSAAITELVFAGPTDRLAEANPRAARYRFDWRSPAFDGQLGACHMLELPFVFDTLAAAPGFVGADPPVALAREMHEAWLRFATGGGAWRGLRRFG